MDRFIGLGPSPELFLDRNTAFYAVVNRNPDLLEEVLRGGADRESSPETFAGPLVRASAMGLLSCVRILVGHGAAVDCGFYRGPRGEYLSPLGAAAVFGHEGVVRFLLDAEAGMLGRSGPEGGHTPMEHAVRNRHDGCLRAMLEAGAANFSDMGRLLLCACRVDGNEQCVKTILATKSREELEVAAEEVCFNDQFVTVLRGNALTVACLGGRKDTVEVLVRAGFKFNETCLRAAVNARVTEDFIRAIVALLLQHGGFTAWNSALEASFVQAARRDLRSVVQLFLDVPGIFMDCVDQNGVTAVAFAVRTGSILLVRDLVLAGADPETSSNGGPNDLCLVWDARLHHPDHIACALTKLIVMGGANPFRHRAIRQRYTVPRLQQHALDTVRGTDGDGLAAAFIYNDEEFVRALLRRVPADTAKIMAGETQLRSLRSEVMRPWRPERHCLFHRSHRDAVFFVLCLYTITKKTAFTFVDDVPLEIWFHICASFGRMGW